jgi:hypothetical protein
VNELRPCGNPRCRLCNPRPVHDDRQDTLAELLLAGAAIVVLAFVAFVLLPVLAS